MNEQKTLSVLVPVGLPAEISWVKEKLPMYIQRKVEPIFLHVVDTAILDRMNQGNISDSDKIFNSLKASAEKEIRLVRDAIGLPQTSVMVVEGSPAIEIIKLARDLQVDMVAMQIHSTDHRLENLFFGSTTEQIIRGSSVPVICIP